MTSRSKRAPEAAAVCALNALAVLEEALGSLDRIERVLTVYRFRRSAPGLPPATGRDRRGQQGAGRRLRGCGAVTPAPAIGVAALPRGGAVELEVTVAVKH